MKRAPLFLLSSATMALVIAGAMPAAAQDAPAATAQDAPAAAAQDAPAAGTAAQDNPGADIAPAPAAPQTPTAPQSPEGGQDQQAARAAPPAGYAAQGDDGDIVVTGFRQSLSSAQALKRDSDSIIDAIVAEDIGKLPDNNASEALARITGVQVNRSNDEANGVLVRGLPDLTTTFNGREIFTAENRGVALQDFPAGALAALEVYKSGTSNLIEPGLAGLINVRSRRPFDFDGLEIAGAIRGTYNDQSNKYDPNGNLLISNRWETGIGDFGALINFAYTQSHYRNAVRYDEAFVRTPVGDLGTTDDDLPVTTPGVGNAFAFPGSIGNYYSRGKRWRPSINGSLQWKPASNLEIYADGLWQAYRGEAANEWFNANLERASVDGVRPTLSNVVLVEGEPNKAASLTKTGGYPAEMYRSTNNDRTDTYQGAIGFVWSVGRAKISSDFAYTTSTYTASEYSLDSQFTSAPTVNAAFDVKGSVDYDLNGYDAQNPANYAWRGYYERRYKAKGDGIQWRADVDLATDFAVLPSIQFGVRYVDRNSSLDQGNRYANTSTLGIPLASLPSGALETVTDGFRSDTLPGFQNWLMPSRSNIRENFAGLQQASIAALTQLAAANPTDAGIADNLARFQTAIIPLDPLGGFTAAEQTYAFYAQGKYELTVGGLEIDGTFGVRAVNTDGRYSGFQRSVDAAGVASIDPITNKQNYLDILPSANMRIKFTPKFQARFAYTETRTRPTFGQLNPGATVTFNSQTSGGQTTGPDGQPLFNAFITRGNPNLQPLTSNNFDATLEWYFSKTGSLTGAVFYRDLYGFINTYTNPVENFEGLGRVQLTQPENAGAGKVKGAEIGVQSFFDFLPGFLSGFGGQANVTYLDGTNELPSALGEQAPIVPITGVSKWTYNLTAFYERGPISTRLSYNRRSQYVNSFNRNVNEEQYAGETTRAVERLDYSLAYTPFKNLTLTADINNILATPFNNYRNYNATQFFPRDVREEGRYYSLGARFRF